MDVLYSYPHDSIKFVDLTAGESSVNGYVWLGHTECDKDVFSYMLTPKQAKALAASLIDYAKVVDSFDFRAGE
jgi:hypothetical protein